MFLTEPILHLQSLASDLLTFLMVAITHMGYEPFYVGLICFIILGVSFRRGFLLLQLFLWQWVINDMLKDFFALPRPVDVDSTIQHLGKGWPNTSPFSSMGAKGFFETLDGQVVEYFRLQSQNDGYSFGFPYSGTLPKRAARVLIGVVICFVTSFIVGLGIDLTGIGHEDVLTGFTKKAIPCFMIMWGSVKISVKLGLYKREIVVAEQREP